MANAQDNAQKGDRLTAESWRKDRAEMKRALRPIQVEANSGLTSRVGPSGQVIGLDRRKLRLKAEPAIVKQFSIQSITDSDHLECKEILEEADTPTSEDTLAEDVTWVLKPWFLRGRFTWDKNFGGPLSRKGIAYTNYSATHQTRTATKGTDPETRTVETQTLVPAYVSGDRLMAIKVDLGRTRLGMPVEWIEWNDSGRMWQVIDDTA